MDYNYRQLFFGSLVFLPLFGLCKGQIFSCYACSKEPNIQVCWEFWTPCKTYCYTSITYDGSSTSYTMGCNPNCTAGQQVYPSDVVVNTTCCNSNYCNQDGYYYYTLGPAAIFGIVLGSVLGFLLLAALFGACWSLASTHCQHKETTPGESQDSRHANRASVSVMPPGPPVNYADIPPPGPMPYSEDDPHPPPEYDQLSLHSTAAAVAAASATSATDQSQGVDNPVYEVIPMETMRADRNARREGLGAGPEITSVQPTEGTRVTSVDTSSIPAAQVVTTPDNYN